MNNSHVYGGSILTHIENTVGPILNKERPYSLNAKIKAYVAEIKDCPGYKLLFTVGLFALCEKECVICLPAEWPLPRYRFESHFLERKLTSAPYFPETLPLDLLAGIVAKCLRKNGPFRIEEGVFLDKKKSPWSKYQWPDAQQGAALLDYTWSKEEFEPEPDDTLITLYTLVPVRENKKNLTPQWHEEQRSKSWEQLAFSPFADLRMLEAMNQAVLNKEWQRIRELVDSGMNVKRGVYRFFEDWGDVVAETYLEYFMIARSAEYADNFAMMQYLIENGASVPPDALAQIAGFADREQFDYFIGLGGDVNAADKVGYTALNRALAFENQSLADYIISLGGAYRVQAHDEPALLQRLIEMGAKLDHGDAALI